MDDGCEIVRLAVAQPIIDVLLLVKPLVSKKPDSTIDDNNVRYDQTNDDQKNVYSRLVQWLNTSFYLFGASKYLFRNRDIIDIIHTHIASWNAGYAGWIGNLLRIPVLCKAAYLPAFLDFDGTVPFPETWRRWRKRIRYIALTTDMADDIVRHGVPSDNIDIVPNGVRIPPDIAAVDINHQVLYVGNFSQGAVHKGFDVMITAWAHVHKTFPDARLIIAGAGESRPWQEMAAALNCDRSIHFAGHVSDLASCYLKTSLFVLPSRSEGISNALLEAQSFGIPAIASDIPGNREVVTHERTGILIPVDNAEALSEAILKLIQDDELRKKMGKAARNRIIEKFSIASIVDRICEVYNFMSKK